MPRDRRMGRGRSRKALLRRTWRGLTRFQYIKNIEYVKYANSRRVAVSAQPINGGLLVSLRKPSIFRFIHFAWA